MADSEDEEEDEKAGKGKDQKLAWQRNRAWLKEGGGDEPLNFLDPNVSQRVLGKEKRTGLPCPHHFPGPEQTLPGRPRPLLPKS